MYGSRKIILLFIVLSCCTTSYGQVIKDTIFFNNGSMIIGKLKKIKLGVVTFDPDDANDITVQLRKLKTIAATHTIFRIETISHYLYYGRLLPSATPKTAILQNGSDSLVFNLDRISILYPFESTVAERFSGTVGFGYSYTKSSGFGRLNFDGKLNYISRKEELTLATSGIYTIYDSLFSRDREEVNLKSNYYFVKNWFATVFVSYQRNLELGLQRRYQEGLGVGNKFITTRSTYAWGRTGFVFNQEKSTEQVTTGTLTELFGQLELNFFLFEKPKINLLVAQTFYYNLSQTGRFRNDGSMSVTWEIFKDFDLSFEPYNNYDSKPPVAGKKHFDYGLVFGINYLFN